MKTLYITRHAKSSWENESLSDHQRPLIPKGIKRTQLVADYLLEKNGNIDLILSSSAVRALETAKLFAQKLNYPQENIRIEENIYHASLDSLSELLYSVSNKVKSVMLVGHNPTFTYFANYFLDQKLDWLPTSGIVCVEFDTEQWENLHIAKKTINFVITPRMLKNR